MRTIRNKVDEMILQTRASIVCDLLAIESEETSHLKAVRDALILAKATAFTAPSDDQTTLPQQKR